MKLRITISKNHSWYLCQISIQIMLLSILINQEHIRKTKDELNHIYYLTAVVQSQAEDKETLSKHYDERQTSTTPPDTKPKTTLCKKGNTRPHLLKSAAVSPSTRRQRYTETNTAKCLIYRFSQA